MVDLIHCPVCKKQNFSKYLDCKDHFLTEEEFAIIECDNCHLRFTNPRPTEIDLPSYYKSEEYISHSNAKGGLVNRIYHKVRNYTIKKKYSIVEHNSHGKNILDIGCGTGELLNYFKLKAWNTRGVEPDPDARKLAIDNYQLNISDFDSLLDKGDSSFDVITMWHVLEHVWDLQSYLDGIKNLLNDNGTFIVAVPNSNSWDAKHYKSMWAAYDVPRHLYHFSQESMNELMESANFKLHKIVPMKFDSYYISLLSEKYKTGKQNILKGFFNGLYSNFYARLNQNNFSSLIFIYKIG